MRFATDPKFGQKGKKLSKIINECRLNRRHHKTLHSEVFLEVSKGGELLHLMKTKTETNSEKKIPFTEIEK